MAETGKNNLKEQVAMLPLSPGVYQFVDRSGTIIYVGKAKSLRKRVSSYFVQSKEHSAKVRVLVRQIAEIRHIVVNSETDALLLENSLIKTLQPRYNILLKDDKTYPWIVVRREHFPRVQSTRQLTRDGSQYFGPYSSVMMQHSVLEFVREVVPLRTCKLNLAPEQIAKGRYSVCLQYHLGNCKGPCVGEQSEAEYAKLVDMVVAVLKGDLRPVRSYLEGEMANAAAGLKFELAQRYKQRLDALDNYSSKSVIVSAKIVDVDVFSLLPDDDVAYCNFVRIRHGSIVGVYTVKLSTGVGGDERDMLTLAIQHIVEHIAGTLAKEVVVPFLPSTTLLFDGVTFTVPKRGEKLELLEFSQKSARIYRAEQLKNLEIKNPERYTERLLNALQKELRLDRQPRHIECFDNSNLQGAHPVASCVVFRDGNPHARSIVTSTSRPWKGLTITLRCAKSSSGVTAVFRKRGPSCPISSLPTAERGRWASFTRCWSILGWTYLWPDWPRTTATGPPNCSAAIRPCWSASVPLRPFSTFWRTFRRRCTVSPSRSTVRNAARRLFIANWSRSKASATRRSARFSSTSAPWRRSRPLRPRSFRRWSVRPRRKKSGLFLKNSRIL